MQFPNKISMLDHLRSDKRIRFQEVVVGGEQVTIVCYMVASPDLWEIPFANECRGVVYDNNGDCISVPFHKFFNLGENERYQRHNVDFGCVTTVLDKVDGSLITPVVINDQVFLKSKKSFESDVALEAQSILTCNIRHLCKLLHAAGYTPIFELTSPKNRVVIDYGSASKLTLLAIRSYNTGLYITHRTVASIAADYQIACVKQYHEPVESLIDNINDTSGIEGYVIRILRGENTDFIKVKSEWYNKRHFVRTNLRIRDVADMVVDETTDDLKAQVSAAGEDISIIEKIEKKVSNQLISIYTYADALYLLYNDDSKKDFALAAIDNIYFGVAVALREGKTPDIIDKKVKEVWKKQYRESYSLNSVFGDFQSETY